MSVRDLSKMGTAKVTLCDQTVIEKCPVGDVEYAFYQYPAMALNQAGIATPRLLSADFSQRRLRMEYIPHQVEQDTVANDDALAMLVRLHNYPVNADWLYHTHAWSDIALDNSLWRKDEYRNTH